MNFIFRFHCHAATLKIHEHPCCYADYTFTEPITGKRKTYKNA